MPFVRRTHVAFLALAVLVESFSRTGRASADIRLATRTLDARDALSPAALAALPGRADLYAIASHRGIDSAFRQAVLAAGAEVLGYLPDHALLVWAEPASLGRLARERSVALIAPIRPEDRVAPHLLALEAGAEVVVELLVVDAVPATAVAESLRTLGLEVLGAGAGARFNRVTARLRGGAADILPRAAAIPGVIAIGRRPYFDVLYFDHSNAVHQAGPDKLNTAPIFAAGIRGEGQVIGTIDSGVDVDLCQFADTMAGLPLINTGSDTAVDPAARKVIAYDFLHPADDPGDPLDWDNNGHGTSVAGILAGDDGENPIFHDWGDGMAPAARLVIQDGRYESQDPCASLAALGCPMVSLTPFLEQAYAQGVRIHANAWGESRVTPALNDYTTACVDVDDFVFRHPDFLLLFAAGNLGPGDDTVVSPSVAKNVVSVGTGYNPPRVEELDSLSSLGWAADGRIKPTVVCVGTDLWTARGDRDVATDNCSTEPARSGTSLATATCGGLAALVRQYYDDGFYPSGRARLADRFSPSAALMKATLINSSRGLALETAVISREQGFGRPTLADTLHLRGGARRLFVIDEPAAFPTGSTASRSYALEVMATTEPLKVTLVWTDPPSLPLAASNLVNDLDLLVRGPTGTYLGNVFAGGSSTTGGSADRLNVEEEVWIATPATGTYTIEVKAANVPAGDQGFALVASGAFAADPGLLFSSASVSADDLDPGCSDRDGRADSGERVRVSVSVHNPASVAATGAAVALWPSGPYATVLSASPVLLADVAPFGSATADFELGIAGADCAGSASFTVAVSSAESLLPDLQSFELPLELDAGTADRRLDFENGLIDSAGQSWIASLGFAPSTARASQGASSLWAGVPPGPGHCDGSGSTDGSYTCARLLSPPLVPAVTSSLTLSTWYDIEPTLASALLTDSANVHVIDGPVHTLLIPSAGRGYDEGTGLRGQLCHLDQEDGWNGRGGASWAASTFDLSPWTGREIQIEVNYSTNNIVICEGIYLDDILVTAVAAPSCDATTCSAGCSVAALTAPQQLVGAKSPPGRASFRWSDTQPGVAEYHVNAVTSPSDLGGVDPQSPHRSPRGQGVLRCATAQGTTCTDFAPLTDPPALLYYQVFAACGIHGTDEGPR